MHRTLLICIIMFFHVSVSFALDKSESSFKEGIKYFKLKNYPEALSFFQKARTQGMSNSALYFNIAVTYYKLGNYKKSESNFRYLLKDNNFRQISFYNLGLIAEKRQQKKLAISWYKKAEKETTNVKITQLATIKLDNLFNRKPTNKKIRQVAVKLAFGNDSNITSSASNSPSNKSDNYLELFTYLIMPVNQNINFKGNIYSINYFNYSVENFMFYEAGFDYVTKIKNWNIIPEFSLSQSTYNNSGYQNIFNLKVTGEQYFKNRARMAVSYRYSDINSQNSLYDYLQGTRHQLRADYISTISSGQLRLRYQIEFNNRKNTPTANYSPVRNEFRVRLKHPLQNNWDLSTELGLRDSKYGTAASITRNDLRLRLFVAASKKLKQNMHAGIRYTHTDNKSNLASETYNKNNIQLFGSWIF